MKRRGLQEIGLSFLDVICCGFGAIILLLMVIRTVEPIPLEESVVSLRGLVVQKRDSLHRIRGVTRELTRELSAEELRLRLDLAALARLEREISDILGRHREASEKSERELAERQSFARAKQSLTEEMERLLGLDFVRASNTIGGITVDSEYIIFVIDTSGSMQTFAWPLAQRKVREALAIYPRVKGIQVMNDMGDYMFPEYAARWIPDSLTVRDSIVKRLAGWQPYSNSSPVEGITRAIETFYAEDRKISIYVFGDDYSGQSIEKVVDRVDQVNRVDETGDRRVRIHGVGFPVRVGDASGNRFAALMRELTYRNNGTFVALASSE